MKRRKFIFGTLAVLTVPMLPSFKTKEEDFLKEYREYFFWFKKEYGESPVYTAPNGKFFIDNLIDARERAMNSTPTNFYGENYYTKETWSEVRHDFLEKTKVLTYGEYLEHIA